MRCPLLGCVSWLFVLGCSSCSPFRSAVRSQADGAAEQFVEKAFTKCGDSYYGMLGKYGTELTQMKDISVTTGVETLSAADKLNGYEWMGEIVIHCRASRAYSSSGRYSGWQEWQPSCNSWEPSGSIEVQLAKKNGQWLYGYDRSPSASYGPKIDCNRIPPPKTGGR